MPASQKPAKNDVDPTRSKYETANREVNTYIAQLREEYKQLNLVRTMIEKFARRTVDDNANFKKATKDINLGGDLQKSSAELIEKFGQIKDQVEDHSRMLETVLDNALEDIQISIENLAHVLSVAKGRLDVKLKKETTENSKIRAIEVATDSLLDELSDEKKRHGNVSGELRRGIEGLEAQKNLDALERMKSNGLM